MKSIKRRIIILVIMTCVLSLSLISSGLAQGDKSLSQQDLTYLLELIENPQKREAFLKDLKTLIQARESAEKGLKGKGVPAPPEQKKRRVLFIEYLFTRFENFSRKIAEATAGTVTLVSRAPKAFSEAGVFFSRPENRSVLFKLLGNIAVSIIIALIIRMALRKYTPKIPDVKRRFTHRLVIGIWRLILGMVPYGALLTALFLLFGIFPSFAIGHSLSLMFFVIVLFYQLAVWCGRVLFSPDESNARMLLLSDENANYCWVWWSRFAGYTAFYQVVTRSMFIFQVAPPSYAFIRSLLLIIFPIMISVLILQVAREIRLKYDEKQTNEEG
jgi:hypothetical protein